MSRYRDHYWGAGPILRDSAAMTLDDIRDVLGEIAGPDPDEPRESRPPPSAAVPGSPNRGWKCCSR